MHLRIFILSIKNINIDDTKQIGKYVSGSEKYKYIYTHANRGLPLNTGAVLFLFDRPYNFK